MISLRKPLGSLESPAASGAGLSPLVDMMTRGGGLGELMNGSLHRHEARNNDNAV